MGIDIYTEGGALHTRNAAWQVIHWCGGSNFTPEGLSDDPMVSYETMGDVYIPPSVAAEADQKVPATYEEAKAQGLVQEDCDERSFHFAREFLAQAAKSSHGISGSY